MNSGPTGQYIQFLTLLLFTAISVAIFIKRFRIPYSIALVIAGLIIGVFQVFPSLVIAPDFVTFAILPPFLFESSWNIHLERLKHDWLSIGVLSTVGVGVSILSIAFILTLSGLFDRGSALLLGAMLSATDPIAVIATFRKMWIHKRLTMIIEGESLFNDGTAMAGYTLVLSVLIASGKTSLPITIMSWLGMVTGGALLGLAFGFLASKLISRLHDHLLEIMLTILVAYGSFVGAYLLGVSPVIAVVTAGIALANCGKKITLTKVGSFWECASFILTSLVFVSVGMQIHLNAITQNAGLIGVGIIALLLSRAAVVYLLCAFVSTAAAPIPYSWRHVLWWGALRGPLSIVMAMSLPQNLPMRETLVIVTYGLVLFTLVVPGLTIERLLHKLGIERTEPKEKASSLGNPVLAQVK